MQLAYCSRLRNFKESRMPRSRPVRLDLTFIQPRQQAAAGERPERATPTAERRPAPPSPSMPAGRLASPETSIDRETRLSPMPEERPPTLRRRRASPEPGQEVRLSTISLSGFDAVAVKPTSAFDASTVVDAASGSSYSSEDSHDERSSGRNQARTPQCSTASLPNPRRSQIPAPPAAGLEQGGPSAGR